MIGNYLNPYGMGGFFGMLGGAFGFAALRLTLVEKRDRSSR